MALKKITLNNLSDAERFVKKERRARWNGWDIVVFVPHPRAYTNKNGRFDRARKTWGFEYTYPVTDNGTWNVEINVRN